MAVLTVTGKAVNWRKPPKATTKCRWSKRDMYGRVVYGSFRTICHLDHLDRLARKKFNAGVVVIQPPFNTGVSASAGTHDLDACLDLYIPGVSWTEQQRFFRANGFACWVRKPPAFSYHIHGFTLPPAEGRDVNDDFAVAGLKVGRYVDGGHSTYGRKVSSSQIGDYYDHRTGLAGHAKDNSWFPEDIKATIFDLKKYVERMAKVPVTNTRPIYHDDNYAKANSAEGDRIAALKKRWADRDLQQAAGGTLLVTHWPHPRKERFRKPDGTIPKKAFSKMSLAEVSDLTAGRDWTIRSAASALRQARVAGVPGIEFDLKFLPSQDQMDRLAKAAENAYGTHWQKYVEVKMAERGPGAGGKWKKGLRRAAKAGFVTTLIRFTGDPENLPPFVSKFRR